MGSSLISNTRGGYQFLLGIAPYSSGVIAMPGHQIVHATLGNALPWHTGLPAAREYLEKSGLSRFNLCGVELRCPAPHAMSGFIEFNRDYRTLLEKWDMLVDRENPLARTNVSPVVSPPEETVLHGFSYSAPSEFKGTTFVVAGGGELPHRDLDDKHIVRFGGNQRKRTWGKSEVRRRDHEDPSAPIGGQRTHAFDDRRLHSTPHSSNSQRCHRARNYRSRTNRSPLVLYSSASAKHRI